MCDDLAYCIVSPKLVEYMAGSWRHTVAAPVLEICVKERHV
jgi:hypothetical protein